jgi:hypothetical protein
MWWDTNVSEGGPCCLQLHYSEDHELILHRGGTPKSEIKITFFKGIQKAIGGGGGVWYGGQLCRSGMGEHAPG